MTETKPTTVGELTLDCGGSTIRYDGADYVFGGVVAHEDASACPGHVWLTLDGRRVEGWADERVEVVEDRRTPEDPEPAEFGDQA